MGVPHQQAPPFNQQQPLLPGAVGGVRDGFALETAVRQLTTSLRGLLEQLRPPPGEGEAEGESPGEESDNDDND